MGVVLGEFDFLHSSGFQGGPALAGSEILLWVVLSVGKLESLQCGLGQQ